MSTTVLDVDVAPKVVKETLQTIRVVLALFHPADRL